MIFRTDRAEDKKVLLMAFKNVAEELMNRKRKEMLSEAEARKGDVSLFASFESVEVILNKNFFFPTSLIFEEVDLITMV